ncbi:hypothetical protein HZS_2588, partial [Henneguya salminicola]
MIEESLIEYFEKVDWFENKPLKNDEIFFYRCECVLKKIEAFNIININFAQITKNCDFFPSLFKILPNLNFPYESINADNCCLEKNKILILDFLISIVKSLEMITNVNFQNTTEDINIVRTLTHGACSHSFKNRISTIKKEKKLLPYFTKIPKPLIQSYINDETLVYTSKIIKEVLKKQVDYLQSDFGHRRAMVIKRLTVTFSSILVKNHVYLNYELKDMKPQVDLIVYLLSFPPMISISDLLLARPEILTFEKISENSAKCSIKKYQIGDVPDRGGRVDNDQLTESKRTDRPRYLTNNHISG